MDIFLNILIVFIMLFFLYILISPNKSKNVKSSVKKKEELIEHYIIKLRNELDDLSGDERKTRKTELLKLYAKELEFNIYFDKDEIKNVIKELATV